MPFEYMAMWREMCAAYRLLEDQKFLKVRYQQCCIASSKVNHVLPYLKSLYSAYVVHAM